MKRTRNGSRNSTEKALGNRKTIAGFDEIDRISNLPKEIICHILSLMPTKYAVGTCILSTKWKNIFPLIPNLRLRLDDTLLLHPESSPNTYLLSFKNFADRLLNVTLRDVSSIHSLHLVCEIFNEGQDIANWIHGALRLNVKKMHLRICRLKNFNFLLDSLFGCNLVYLNLDLKLDAAGDDAREWTFSFPNLKMLLVQYTKPNLINVLLASCPLLEYLIVSSRLCCPGETLRISLHSLKALILISGTYGLEGEIEIEAPRLEYICYSGYLANRYSARNLKSLQIARLDLNQLLDHYPYEQAVELMKVCAHVEQLLLSKKFVQTLHHYPHPLPRYQKMTTLVMQNMDSKGWDLLPRLLECAPNLNKLFLIKADFDKESYERFIASLKKPLYVYLSQHGKKCSLLKIQRKLVRIFSQLLE